MDRIMGIISYSTLKKNTLPKLSFNVAWIAIFLIAFTLKDFLMTLFKKSS